ncbi:MAG: hypothetical protein U0531_21465, partial [Dehalococcoidia bacterium]
LLVVITTDRAGEVREAAAKALGMLEPTITAENGIVGALTTVLANERSRRVRIAIAEALVSWRRAPRAEQ